MSLPLITLENINYTRDRRSLLQSINVEINKGEFITLVGPNGAGKTTLLKILLKLIKPTTGKVIHNPSLVIGYVPQRISINPLLPLTVEQFIRDISKEKNVDISLFEALRLTHLKNRSVHALSGGELQRVLLAQAITRNPHILILDEPDQGLDVTGQIHLYEILKNIQDTTHCAIFLVSHHLHLVFAKSHRVLCLNHHICCHGKPEDVRQHDSFQKLFPEFSNVLAPYKHDHDHSHG